jgi:hypothetical protein
LFEDINQRGKDIAVPVGQQGRRVDVLHIGDVMVQLDEADRGVFASNGEERVFHN